MGSLTNNRETLRAAVRDNGRLPIGIIAGSGPEAGADLWAKVIKQNQRRLGDLYRGDIDAPEVIIRSDPLLGLSMELEQNEGRVWERLHFNAAEISNHTSAYAIACNTLNYFETKLHALSLPTELVSFQVEVTAFIRRQGLSRVSLLGAAPVMSMGPWSPYYGLSDLVEVESLKNIPELHHLIYDVKEFGAAHPSLRPRFAEILRRVESETVLLACTELPLIADIETDKHLVDVTDLVADALVARSFADHHSVADRAQR